jgi:hypothetical protein
MMSLPLQFRAVAVSRFKGKDETKLPRVQDGINFTVTVVFGSQTKLSTYSLNNSLIHMNNALSE